MGILIFIFIYSILIACVTVLVLAYDLTKRKKEYFKEILEVISSDADLSGGTDVEMEKVIDDRLSDMVSGFKKKIPMIGMFLNQTKENELKELAKQELMQMIPAIKQKFLSSDYLSQIADRLVNKLRKNLLKRVLVVSVCVGALLGVVEALLVYLWSAGA